MGKAWKVSVYRAGVWEEPISFTDHAEARAFFLSLERDKTVRASMITHVFEQYPTKPIRTIGKFFPRKGQSWPES